jgi:23S rRNA pseudouridine1911/1915/1917 synthase
VTLQAPAAAAGARLDRFLADLAAEPGSPLAGLTRARLQGLIDDGRVRVDGAAAKSSRKLRGGERVEVSVPPPEPLTLAPEAMALDILFEDGDLIVLSKPAGLAVHPGAGRRHGTLVSGLLAHCRDLSGIGGVLRPGIVHRLDRGTSGVLVIAKHDRAHLALARQFAERRVDKRYVAFVLGTPSPRVALIETPYGRHPTQRLRFTSKVARGKRAVTRYEVVASGGGVARLAVKLETGRTHQIRVHLAERGHPVVGDPLYGGRRWGKLDDAVRAAAEALGHQALHAAELSLAHPGTGEVMRFVAPLPADLVALDEAMNAARSGSG